MVFLDPALFLPLSNNIWMSRCPLESWTPGSDTSNEIGVKAHHEKPCARWSPCPSHHSNLTGFVLTQNKLKEQRRKVMELWNRWPKKFQVHVLFSYIQQGCLHHPIIFPLPAPNLLSLSPSLCHMVQKLRCKILRSYILGKNFFFFLIILCGEDRSKNDMFKELLWLLPSTIILLRSCHAQSTPPAHLLQNWANDQPWHVSHLYGPVQGMEEEEGT